MLAIMSRMGTWLYEQDTKRRDREHQRLQELDEFMRNARTRLQTRCVSDDARNGVHARREASGDLTRYANEFFRLAVKLGRADLIAAYY